jgi:hypothetical protein
VAGLPFFMVIDLASFISRLARHFTQYACIIPLLFSLLGLVARINYSFRVVNSQNGQKGMNLSVKWKNNPVDWPHFLSSLCPLALYLSAAQMRTLLITQNINYN